MVLKNLIKIFQIPIRHRATIASFQEVKIPVPWGHIAGKWYGPSSKRPILTLHGWQDNCGSFNRLIPLLNKDVSFLAIDFPGHGLSSRLPSGMYYHFSNYILLIEYLANYFKWSKVSLMGHSLGGVASFTYNMLCPDKVDFVICLDIDPPLSNLNDAGLWHYCMKNFWVHNKYLDSEPPSYTMSEILERISKGNLKSVKLEYANHIAERNILPSKTNPQRYYFSRDPRVRLLDLVLPNPEDLTGFIKEITGAVLLIFFKGNGIGDKNLKYRKMFDALKKSKEFNLVHVEGNHHGHLNTPETIVSIIDDFIKKHRENTEPPNN